MLKNISSMNKKADKELLEIPEFLLKLSKEQPQDVTTPSIEQNNFTPITEIKEEEAEEPVKVKPKVDIQAKIKEHTQLYYIDVFRPCDVVPNHHQLFHEINTLQKFYGYKFSQNIHLRWS